MKSDIEIAREAELENIYKIAEKLNINEEYVEPYGKHKAKIDLKIMESLKDDSEKKLVLVTAISPTPAGEGKTTTTVGLGDALNKLGEKVAICLREPSVGPIFGVKGGAAGGGYAQVVPMEEINLHFTGDIHAITAANNLIAAMLDNHIYQGNDLNIDPRRITWKRSIDMNDRQLRNIVSGLSGRTNGVPREDGFNIAVASEIMAIFCLSNNLTELKDRVSKTIIAYTYENKPVYVSDIKAQGAVVTLLKDAFNPNLVQTLEGTPTFIHGGPFANIAHGCNSLIATKLARGLSDIVVTEAGFGADLGAEKFINIKCRKSGLSPNAVVLVATIRALKYQGGESLDKLNQENLDALKNGCKNLCRHIENIKNGFNLPVIVALNSFLSDTDNEFKVIEEVCSEIGVDVVKSTVFSEGSVGGMELAKKVVETVNAEKAPLMKFSYDDDMPLKEKIKSVASSVYRANNVKFAAGTITKLKSFEKLGYGDLPVCIAKTQYSFSDNPKKLGATEDFDITINNVELNSGAGFIVCSAGNIMRMPGLPKVPSAEKIDVDENGLIVGLS
ncbi:MAG: formate--tetrahydrofolate ligase [Lachnospirales bacterium]